MNADLILEHARRVIAMERAQLTQLEAALSPTFPAAVILLEETLRAEHKVIIIGVGKSESIGHKFAATLNSTGATAVTLSCQNALHGDLGILSRGDLVLCLSHSGETPELINLLPHLRKRARQLIAITGKNESTLAQHSDLVLETGVTAEACPLGLAPTCSSTNMLVLCDALAMVLLEARGFRSEDFAELHPGGSLGKYLLTRVSDVMRPAERVARVLSSATVQDTVLAMLRHRSGAAAVVSAENTLLGIFTHGDFVRGYQDNRALGDAPVRDHMTPDPITAREGDLAASVLRLIREHRIDDVLVLDDGGKVTGLVDVQDLSGYDLS